MKYLTEKDLERSWAFGTDVCEMRREFRKLLDVNPEAFATCVREYMEYGEARFPELETTGGRYPTPRHALAGLLAEYRIAQENGVTRECFIESQASKGVNAASKYSRVVWSTDSAIRENLKKASKLAKQDQGFADDVDSWESNLRFIRGSRRG